jgi:hypothetical protein
MMPGTGPRNDGRKKRALTAAFTGGGAVMAYVVVSASRFGAWEWVPLAAGLAVITAIAVAGVAGRPGGRRRGSGQRARLNIISHPLSQVPYKPLAHRDIKLPKR